MTTKRQYIEQTSQDTLILASDECPAAQPGEVIIRVAAAGVNRADVLQRLGLYPVPDDASPILGLEVSGEVIAVGEGVVEPQVGSRVCALVHGGGYATHAVARADHCLPLAEHLTHIQGAALPEALLTAWHNMVSLGELAEGKTILIHGGASGIGSIAVQMALALGATVVATAGGAEKCNAVSALGAHCVVDYRAGNLATSMAAAGFAGQFDVILDIAGGDFVNQNLQLAAKHGRVVCIGMMRGAEAEINLLPILLNNLVLTGSTLRGMDKATRAAGFTQLRNTIMPKVNAGAITPLIDSILPLDQAMVAHTRMQSGSHIGKIVLDCATASSA